MRWITAGTETAYRVHADHGSGTDGASVFFDGSANSNQDRSFAAHQLPDLRPARGAGQGICRLSAAAVVESNLGERAWLGYQVRRPSIPRSWPRTGMRSCPHSAGPSAVGGEAVEWIGWADHSSVGKRGFSHVSPNTPPKNQCFNLLEVLGRSLADRWGAKLPAGQVRMSRMGWHGTAWHGMAWHCIGGVFGGCRRCRAQPSATGMSRAQAIHRHHLWLIYLAWRAACNVPRM